MKSSSLKTVGAPLRPSEAGFILPMTLVVLSIIGLSLWAAMSVLNGMRGDLQQLGDDVRLEAAARLEPVEPGHVDVHHDEIRAR